MVVEGNKQFGVLFISTTNVHTHIKLYCNIIVYFNIYMHLFVLINNKQ